jgi:hypothetical protein
MGETTSQKGFSEILLCSPPSLLEEIQQVKVTELWTWLLTPIWGKSQEWEEQENQVGVHFTIINSILQEAVIKIYSVGGITLLKFMQLLLS